MPRPSVSQVIADVPILINDNVVGDISPADLRSILDNILKIIQPSYGILSIPAPSTTNLTLGTAAQPMLWTNFAIGGAPQYSSADNAVVRCDQSASTRIDLTMDVEAANGRAIIAILYKNGVATSLSASATGAGSGNPVSINFSLMQYSDGVTNYELFVKSDTAGTSAVFSNCALLLSNVPVNSYV